MARKFYFLIIWVFAAVMAPAWGADPRAAKIDAVVAAEPDFSGVVLVADGGMPIYQRAAGYRNYTEDKPMTTDAIFELASVSKQFTAMTIMILKEEGKLDYGDPVAKYLPDLPYPGITIRHLLNHVSGLPDYEALMAEHWDKSKVATNADILAYLKQYKPAARFAPGEKYEYSNGGYVLLASIAEKVSGQDFREFSRQRIYRPLAMTDTDIRSPQEWDRIERFALGYEFDKDSNRYVRATDLSEATYTVYLGGRYGPGRVSSTAADLLKWDRGLHDGRIVSTATLEDAFQPAVLNDGSLSQYGFGWSVKTDPVLGRLVHHSGGNPGYATHIYRFIDADKTMIILSNNSYRFNDMAEGIMAVLREHGPAQ